MRKRKQELAKEQEGAGDDTEVMAKKADLGKKKISKLILKKIEIRLNTKNDDFWQFVLKLLKILGFNNFNFFKKCIEHSLFL